MPAGAAWAESNSERAGACTAAMAPLARSRDAIRALCRAARVAIDRQKPGESGQ
jgi:hypothetical protein